MHNRHFIRWAFAIMAMALCIVPAAKSLAAEQLNVIAAYNAKDDIFDQFSKDTGIKVNFLDMSSGEVLARMRAEKGRPLADIWFGGGVDAFIAAKTDGLLEPYVSPEAAHIPAQFKDPQGYWTGISLVTVNLVVNKARLEEKGMPLPKGWADLTGPDYKDEISMSNPSVSGTAFFTLYGLLTAKGEKEGWNFFGKLNDNIPFYAKRGSEPPQRAAMGESIVGIAPGLWDELEAQGYPITVVFPADGIPWWPAPVAIFKDAANMKSAKTLVDWALSAKGQEYLKSKDPRFPTREGVAPPEAMKHVDMSYFIPIDFTKAGKDRERVVKTWQEKFSK